MIEINVYNNRYEIIGHSSTIVCYQISMWHWTSSNVIKCIKLPVVIEAIQWDGNNLKEIIAFIGLHESAHKWTWEEYEKVVAEKGLKIFTLEGPHIASIGDYIIKGVNGEFYPCKPNIFEKNYEKVNERTEK